MQWLNDGGAGVVGGVYALLVPFVYWVGYKQIPTMPDMLLLLLLH